MEAMNATAGKMNWCRLVQDLVSRMSQTQLARRVEVNPKEIGRWLKGQHQPQGEYAVRLLQQCAFQAINPRKYEGLKPIYGFERSFEQNIHDGPGWLPPEPPHELPQIGTKLWDFVTDSPIGIPACVLTANSNWIAPQAKRGFDIITAKTRRSRLLRPHPFPNLAYVPELRSPTTPGAFPKAVLGTYDSAGEDVSAITLANSFGMPSEAPHEWQADLEKSLKLLTQKQVLIASVVGTSDDNGGDLVADFLRVANLAAEVRPHAIELNFSCPNVYGKEGSIYQDADLAEQICRKVAKEIGNIKLVVKVGYLPLEPLRALFNKICRFVHGIAAINTVSTTVLSEGQRDEPLFPGKKRGTGGISGVAIKNHALSVVRDLRKLADQKKSDLAIFGMGGISNLADVKRFIESGATCVQICTAAMFNPLLAVEIRHEWSGHKGPSGSRAFIDSRIRFTDDYVAETYTRALEVAGENRWPADEVWDLVQTRWVGPYKKAMSAAGSPVKARAQAPTSVEIKETYIEKLNAKFKQPNPTGV